MKKKVVVSVLVFGVLGALALPVSNLVVGGPKGTALAKAAAADPKAAPVAALLEPRCAHCHEKDVPKPFYAVLPVAGPLIEKDIAVGLRHMDFAADLFPTAAATAEPALAKLERTLALGTMPPVPYLALHWNARLSAEDAALVTGWVREVRAAKFAPASLTPEQKAAVLHPLVPVAGLDARKVALGKKLYHDPRLSGDDTVSCASCHALDKGGTDQLAVSKGIKGQLGGINAPTTFNAVYNVVQFWDGRAATLADQADGPPNNPVEMGTNWPQITGKLNADAAFKAEFEAVYPAGFSKETVTNAIAEFEKTLVTVNSRFDKFLLGDTAALSDEEKRGHEVFLAVGCATCHVGKALGGQSFELMGLKGDYFADRGKPTDADLGRFAVTKSESDRHRFKVPTLRNIAKTFPYFHDGSAADLAAAVRAMAKYQTTEALTDADVAAVVKFLEALTGEYEGKLL